MSARNGGDVKSIVILQLVKSPNALDNVDDFPWCIVVRWSRDEEADGSINDLRGLRTRKESRMGMFWGEFLDSIQGTMNKVPASFDIGLLKFGMHWPQHRLCTNHFFKYGCEGQ